MQIVMTMYNEPSELLLRTLNSVIKNIAHLCSRDRSKTWGHDAWKKVVVCIVADGRKIVDQRVLKVLQLMGVYAEGVAKDTVVGKEVQAHVFEWVRFEIHLTPGTRRRSSCRMLAMLVLDPARSSCCFA